MGVEFRNPCWGKDEEYPPSPSSGTPRKTTDNPPTLLFLLRGAWEAKMCREQRAHVEGTTQQGTRVLGMHLYTDATVPSSSGAVLDYPLRIWKVNGSMEQLRSVTLVIIHQLEAKFLETRRSSEVPLSFCSASCTSSSDRLCSPVTEASG